MDVARFIGWDGLDGWVEEWMNGWMDGQRYRAPYGANKNVVVHTNQVYSAL